MQRNAASRHHLLQLGNPPGLRMSIGRLLLCVQALLRRVFQTAADLWREEVGVLLHTRNFQAMRAVFDTWQLRVLELQELRRQQILWNAAAAFR